MALGLDLSGSTAKVARAKEHFESLQGELSEIQSQRNPYEAILDRKGKSSTYSLVLHAGNFNEPRLGIILGDLVHNLRSALDYIVIALAEKSGISVTKDHQFPICDDERDYKGLITRMLAGITYGLDEIANVQPFKRTPPQHDALFAINYFSNSDKHRIISEYVPIIGPITGHLSPKNLIVKSKWFPPPLYLRSNQDFEIAQVTLRLGRGEITFKGNISVAVHFGAPPFGKRIKGLGAPHGFFKHCCDHVAMIVDLFKAL